MAETGQRADDLELQPDVVAANCLGVLVPQSGFLNEKRIARINAARYEGQEIAGALHVIEEGDRVLEIGAGIGVVGGVMARHSGAERILSFEANPQLIPVVRALYAMNGLDERIEVRNEVLVTAPDAPEAMEFHVRSSYLGSSLLNPEGRPSDLVRVPTRSFAEVCPELQPNVLIMDIEGGELELLRHMDLSGFRGVVLEFHPEAYGIGGMRECKNVLRDAGFTRTAEKSTRIVWTCLRMEVKVEGDGASVAETT